MMETATVRVRLEEWRARPRSLVEASELLLDDTAGLDSREEVAVLDEVATRQGNVEHLLYISHFLSTWNSRSFEFGAFLFLATIYPSTLLPASIYALARAAAAAIISPWLGTVMDRYDRLVIIRASIAGQRIPVLLSCLVLVGVLTMDELRQSKLGFALTLLSLSLFACLEKLSSVANTIAIERDWVVEIARDDEANLNRLNARMRRIDLFCKLVAPLIVSFVDTYSTLIAIAVTGILNVFSCWIEYFAIARVYRAVPELQSRMASAAAPQSTLLVAFKAYATSPVMLPSLALSILYLTALSFAGQLITFLLAAPLSLSALLLSVIRGVAACVELSSTFIAPRLISRIGPVRAGIWFLNIELFFIGLAASALWLPGLLSTGVQATVLVGAVVLSRFGLWGFDLSAQQQIQSLVSKDGRGAFSSVEAALQNVFEMTSFAATIIWARPDQFKYPAALSAGAVLTAAFLYAVFVRQSRGHLLHLEQALCCGRYWQTHFGKRVVGDDVATESLLRPDAG